MAGEVNIWVRQLILHCYRRPVRDTHHTHIFPRYHRRVEVLNLIFQGMQRDLQSVPQLPKMTTRVIAVPVCRSHEKDPKETQERRDDERPKEAADTQHERRTVGAMHLHHFAVLFKSDHCSVAECGYLSCQPKIDNYELWLS